MPKRLFALSFAFALVLLAFTSVRADDNPVIEIAIKDHLFHPDRIEVDAGKAFVLIVKNEDGTPEEFESHDLNREKLIGAHDSIKIKFPALDAGEYGFVGEFHEDTAKGVIVVK